MKRNAPIEVSGLRKAPAIVVNVGDQVMLGYDPAPYESLAGWFRVLAYAGDHGLLVEGSNAIFTIRVDQIDEWRKG